MEETKLTKEELEQKAAEKKLEELQKLRCLRATKTSDHGNHLQEVGKPTYHIVSGLATVHCYGCGTTLIQRSHSTERTKMMIEAYEMHKEAETPQSRGCYYNRLQK